MKTFLFRTTATMKEYNREKYWIDSNIISEKHITAETITAALAVYRKMVFDNHYVTISESAIKHKSPMYIDCRDGSTKQVGYVITAKTDFELNNGTWKEQFIDLWVTIETIVETVF